MSPLATTMPGRPFGELVVVKRAGKTADGEALWLCLCSCGNTTLVRRSNLKPSKHTRSCGHLPRGMTGPRKVVAS